jgi:polar amino acid transport system substrate-binding protein
MKKHCIGLLCFGLMIYAVTAKAATLELVTLQYPPYQYEEKGQTKGMVVEIVKEVFRRMQQPINITLMPWARSIKMIEAGTADAIFTAYKTAERETFADYSRVVLMPQTVALFVLKGTEIKFDGDLQKLASYSFGVVNKVSYGDVFDNAVKNKLIKAPDTTYTGEQNVDKLLAKRFDILVSNRYGALDILKHKDAMDKVRELTPEVQAIPSYIAFSKKRNLDLVRDKFDEILLELKKDGTYEKIIHEHSKAN